MENFYEVMVVGDDFSAGLAVLECEKQGLKTFWLKQESLSLGDVQEKGFQEIFCELIPQTPHSRHLIKWCEELLKQDLYLGTQPLNHIVMENSTKQAKPFEWRSKKSFSYDFFLKPEALKLEGSSRSWMNRILELTLCDTKEKSQIQSIEKDSSSGFVVRMNDRTFHVKKLFWSGEFSRLQKLMKSCRAKTESSQAVLYMRCQHKVPLQENSSDVFYLMSSMNSSEPEVWGVGRMKFSDVSEWMSHIESTDPKFIHERLQKIKKMMDTIKPQMYKTIAQEFIGFRPESYGLASDYQAPEGLEWISPLRCQSEGLLAQIQSAFEATHPQEKGIFLSS